MADPEHVKIARSGAEEIEAWRGRIGVAPALDLAGADLEGVILVQADLSGANIRGARLARARLVGANLRNADLHDAVLEEADLSDANLARADLTGTRLCRAKLGRAQLSGAQLCRADLSGAALTGARLYEANLEDARLPKADLSRVSARSANFTGADLDGAMFHRAELVGANLSRAVLRAARLSEATCWLTVFGDVDLSQAEGLDAVHHLGPSTVSLGTLLQSKGKIPALFLRGCGLTDWEIELANLYAPELSSHGTTDVAYRVVDLRTGAPIKFFKCFISYSHEDGRFAARLHEALQSRGVRCWLYERHMPAGGRIENVIDEVIRFHEKFLLCCSQASLQSWWVEDEIRKALEVERKQRKTIIIPLRLDDYLEAWDNGLRTHISWRDAPDFREWERNSVRFEEEVRRLATALQADQS